MGGERPSEPFARRVTHIPLLMPSALLSRPFRALALTAGLFAMTGCSIKTMAVKTVANTLSDSGAVFARDDDPDLVRDAVPFALKLYEYLAVGRPVVSTAVAGFRDAPASHVTVADEAGFAAAVARAAMAGEATLEPPTGLPSWDAQAALMARVLAGLAAAR